MKKLTLAAILLASSSSAFAVSPGGPNCGWGNMAFEGKSGLVSHMLGSWLNGSTGNNTFGMSSGTNGCVVKGKLTYGGKSILAFNSIMTEFAEDTARGEGEALTTVAIMMGVEKQDRVVFAEVAHSNFNTLFPNDSVTAEEVLQTLVTVMKNDQRLAKYIV